MVSFLKPKFKTRLYLEIKTGAITCRSWPASCLQVHWNVIVETRSLRYNWGVSVMFTTISPVARQFLKTHSRHSINIFWMALGIKHEFSSVQLLSPVWLCDPMDCSLPDFPVHHQLLELAQTHVHWVSDAIQPSPPLSLLSPSALNLSQHQGLFQIF